MKRVKRGLGSAVASMAAASAVAGGGGELVQVVLKPLGGGPAEAGGIAGELGRRRNRQVLEREFAAVADSWIATVSWLE